MILLAFLSGISTGASDAELGFDRFSICVQASGQNLTGPCPHTNTPRDLPRRQQTPAVEHRRCEHVSAEGQRDLSKLHTPLALTG